VAHEFEGKYLSLTSFKRDGAGVATPVWFVAENGRLLVETDADSYKAKRIRRNASVTVALCTASGKLLGDPVPALAEFLPEHERERVQRLIGRKYRVDRIVVLPVYRAVQRILGKQRLPQEKPVILAITPE
jgi:PPOX class probable F420-dependent enzyme